MNKIKYTTWKGKKIKIHVTKETFSLVSFINSEKIFSVINTEIKNLENVNK